MFAVVWLAVAILVGVPGAINPPSGAPAKFATFWLASWLGIGILVFTMIRWISRADDVCLRRLIFTEFEAEELAS